MSSNDHFTVRIGVLGCGTVGSSFISILRKEAEQISNRTGISLEIIGVAVKNRKLARPVEIDSEILTSDAAALVADPMVDVIVETIGGLNPARQLVLDALRNGKPVITANKELVATYGKELFDAAAEGNVDLMFEAAVAGAVPLIRVLNESLIGERITRVMGIVNGTTNFILTKMTEDGANYSDVLAEAQALGFAEADPTADVDGHDAGAKAAIIAMMAFGVNAAVSDVYREGISNISADDIAAAKQMGHVIKLLAVVERDGEKIGIRVHPAMIPNTHPLASVRDSFNAVFVEGEAVDEVMLYGRGAGGKPTASAMLGDLIATARNLQQGSVSSVGRLSSLPISSIEEMISAYYLQLDVNDAPGVLALVAGIFGENGVSIRSMDQEGKESTAHLVFITHKAREADMQKTIKELRKLEEVRDIGALIRVVGD
ncbi:MAG: homoserine dehydrogenase [Candidatus Poriferisodalaceae bacterium]|jgi:homoserine dehydrogenase|tara:strand:- start:223 stop:1515 length:1293 start_codon:yes stop_codon:yes gene_type:complete